MSSKMSEFNNFCSDIAPWAIIASLLYVPEMYFLSYFGNRNFTKDCVIS